MRSSQFRTLGLASLGVLFLAACGEDMPSEPEEFQTVEESNVAQSIARHIFVLTEEDIPDRTLVQEIGERGGVIDMQFNDFGLMAVSGLTDENAAALGARDDVNSVERDMVVQWAPGIDETLGLQFEAPGGLADQSGAFYFAQGMQWNMTQVHAPAAWGTSGAGDGVVVAILDSGIDPFHLDLNGKVLAGSRSVLTPGSSPCGAFDEDNVFDLHFHGTFVGGLVSSNGIAMASVAPDADLYAVKVLNCSGSGSFGDIINGIANAYYNGADVINMSLGAYFPASAPGAAGLINAMQRIINYVTSEGVLFVAAAGNDAADLDNDGDFIVLPAQLDNVMSVSATAPYQQMNFDDLATYSNFGVSGVDIAAPGGDFLPGGICAFSPIFRCDLVISALSSFLAPGGSPNFYTASAGTSFSSPMVAGAAAVLASTPSAVDSNPAAWAHCLQAGADDLGPAGIDPVYGHGRLNVIGALACGEMPEEQ